jgi:hypothetical protein
VAGNKLDKGRVIAENRGAFIWVLAGGYVCSGKRWARNGFTRKS